MATIKSRGCCICKNPVADAHHLRIIGHKRGMSVKNGDDYTIPLCRRHHDELHAMGDEKLFLDLHGIDPVKVLRQVKGGTDEQDTKHEVGARDSDEDAW